MCRPAVRPGPLLFCGDDRQIYTGARTGKGVDAGRPQALRVSRHYVSEIRAVLLDLGLPGMTGQEEFREIHRLHPTTPIILMTGLAEADARAGVNDLLVAARLQKPLSYILFLEKVREAVEGYGQGPKGGNA